MSAGDFTTRMPAASMAFIFSAAVPLPPAMMAPAWPMRRPGGAVWPAMKPTTGFFTWTFTYSAASSSALPPISPIMTIASVAGSSLKSSRASVWLVPMIGSPPMPMQVDWPMPSAVSWRDRLVGERPAAADHADRPALWMWPGMIPILHFSPGEMIPGQLGPMRRVWPVLEVRAQTFTMSRVGMPSVMQTTTRDARRRPPRGSRRPRPAGGTKMTEALAPVFAHRLLRRCRRSGSPRRSSRPCPG